MIALIAVVAVAMVAAVTIWAWRRPYGATADLQRFNAARAMTTRWAEDPASAPQPVREMAARLCLRNSEVDEGGASAGS